MRRAREAVFVCNQNIGEDEVLIHIVDQMGLDGKEMVGQAALESAQELLEADFQLSSRLGVRGFPTIVMVNEADKGVKVVGARSLDTYVQALQQITAHEFSPKKRPRLSQLVNEEGKLFSKEIEIMYDIEANAVEAFIEAELPEGSYRVQAIMGELYVDKLN